MRTQDPMSTQDPMRTQDPRRTQDPIYSVNNFKYLFLDKSIVYKEETSLARAKEMSVRATSSQIYYTFSAVD